MFASWSGHSQDDKTVAVATVPPVVTISRDTSPALSPFTYVRPKRPAGASVSRTVDIVLPPGTGYVRPRLPIGESAAATGVETPAIIATDDAAIAAPPPPPRRKTERNTLSQFVSDRLPSRKQKRI